MKQHEVHLYSSILVTTAIMKSLIKLGYTKEKRNEIFKEMNMQIEELKNLKPIQKLADEYDSAREQK